jgi:hypothetical protein
MNNLFIIGNGFDLAHNLKTSYENFIRYLIESNSEKIKHNRIFNSQMILSLDDIKKFPYHEENDFINISNIFFRKLLIDISLKKWCDIEEKYYELLKLKDPKDYNEMDNNFPKNLNDEFEIIKKYLSEYLSNQENTASKISAYAEMFKLLDNRGILILNFNYTNTLQHLYKKEIIHGKIIHMHGQLHESTNPMVFGYAASEEESRELINRNNKEYMRNIKKHLYKRTDNQSQLINYLENNKNINVFILGHSCGLSDKLILNQIFTHKNIQNIRVFYYEEDEQYFQTLVNIDRIMNDDEIFKNKFINFKDSHRMPQYTDNQTQNTNFIKYIQNIKNIQLSQEKKIDLTNVFH